MGDFQVTASTGRGTIDDLQRAMTAPESELLPLTEEQKHLAKQFGVPEEEYQRGLLVGRYGDLRLHQRGEKLGTVVNGILQPHGSYYFVKSVVLDEERNRWVVEVIAKQPSKKIAIEADLADAIVDFETVQDLEKLRRLILSSLGMAEGQI